MHEMTDGGIRLTEVSLGDGENRRVILETGGAIYSTGYAPTGAPLIAYVSDETGRPEVHVCELTEEGVGPAIPVTTRGAWSCSWFLDDEQRLQLLHVDLDRRVWVTEVSFDERIEIGQTMAIQRRAERYLATDVMQNGMLVAIKHGEDEAPATRLELVQGWYDSVRRSGR